MNKSVSPSRTYVAMCNKTGFDGYYFKRFKLPESVPNDSETAAYYFLNQLDNFACIDGCFSIEDYENINTIVSPFGKDVDITERLEMIKKAIQDRIKTGTTFYETTCFNPGVTRIAWTGEIPGKEGKMFISVLLPHVQISSLISPEFLADQFHDHYLELFRKED